MLRPEPIAGQTGLEGGLLVTQVLRCGSDLLRDSGPRRSPGPGGGIPTARRFSSFLGTVLGKSAGHADSRPLSGPPGHRGRGLGAQVGGRCPRGRTNVCLPLRGPQHLPRASVCLSPVFDRLCPALSGCLSVWVSPVCLSRVLSADSQESLPLSFSSSCSQRAVPSSRAPAPPDGPGRPSPWCHFLVKYYLPGQTILDAGKTKVLTNCSPRAAAAHGGTFALRGGHGKAGGGKRPGSGF